MDYDISIIIPCYNSEAFISNTIEMIEKNDDIEKCEIVLIDDGSTDGTLKILQDYRSIYDNIVIVSEANCGVSVARNNGLKVANGRYIYFLDSDDLIEKDALSFYKRKISEHGDCDMLSFGYKMIRLDGTETIYKNSVQNDSTIEGNKVADLFFRGKFFLNICSILIKKDFIIGNDLSFKEGIKIGEDFDFLREAITRVNKVYCSDKICFIYKLREGSATNAHNRYGLDSFRSLLLSFDSADSIKGIISTETINYFKASRYSAHLRSYLRSDFSDDDINLFFQSNRYCLFEKMSRGRTKVMFAISIFRIIPLKVLFCAFKK